MLAIKRKAKGKREESEKKSRNIFATFSSPEPLGLICKWLRNGGLRGLTFFFSIFALPMADGKNGKGLKKLFYWFCFSDGTPGWNICTTVLARLSDCGVCLHWLPRAVWEMSRRKKMWEVKTAKRPPRLLLSLHASYLFILFYFISYFTYFFLVSDFAPYSTIWTPGTCYTLFIIDRDVDCQGPALYTDYKNLYIGTL